MPTFGVRPYPHPIESLNGYLIRLATWNGLQGISELTKVIGMDKPKLRNWGNWRNSDVASLAAALSKVLTREEDQVLAPIAAHLSLEWMYSKKRMVEQLSLDFPRICVQCLADSDVMDWRWELGTVARCHKHCTLLINTCFECNMPLEWKLGLLDGCPHCDLRWKNVPVDMAPVSLSPLERQLWPSDDGVLHSLTVVNDVCAAIVAIARPFDSMSQSVLRLPEIKNHSMLVMNALMILQYDTAFEYMQHYCDEVRSPLAILGESVVRAQAGLIEMMRSNYRISSSNTTASQSFKLIEHKEYLKPSRIDTNTDKAYIDARYQCSRSNFELLFEINVSVMDTIVDKKHLPLLKEVRVHKFQSFNLLSLVEPV